MRVRVPPRASVIRSTTYGAIGHASATVLLDAMVDSEIVVSLTKHTLMIVTKTVWTGEKQTAINQHG